MAFTISGPTFIIVLALLASCGANDQSNEGSAGAVVQNTAVAKISLASDAFSEGGPIPTQYTCDGPNQRPALHWSEPPQHTRSFTLVIDDPDSPSGTFRHWGVFDIPSSARSIGSSEKIGKEVNSDFGKPGYSGPCPPKGDGPHHYHFKLFALDVDLLGVSTNAKVAEVERAAAKHVVGQGELVGIYERN